MDLDDLGEGVKEQVADVTGVVWEAWPGKTPVSIDEEPTPVEETGPPAWAVS